jgi:hypothetical protein
MSKGRRQRSTTTLFVFAFFTPAITPICWSLLPPAPSLRPRLVKILRFANKTRLLRQFHAFVARCASYTIKMCTWSTEGLREGYVEPPGGSATCQHAAGAIQRSDRLQAASHLLSGIAARKISGELIS